MRLAIFLNKKIDNSKFRDLLVPISFFNSSYLLCNFSLRLFTSGGLASALIVTTPLILLFNNTDAIVGRGGVDLAVSDGFHKCYLFSICLVMNRVTNYNFCILYFSCVAYQIIQAIIIIFIRVSHNCFFGSY